MSGKGRPGRGAWHRPVVAALTVLALVTGNPGVRPAAEAREDYSAWRLVEPISYDVDRRLVDQGLIVIERFEADARGGLVQIKTNGGNACPGAFQRFRYRWRVDRDVSRIGGKRGDLLFVLTPSIESDGPGRDRQGQVCMDQNPMIARFFSDGDLVSIQPQDRCYAKPETPGNRCDPRSFFQYLVDRETGGWRFEIDQSGPPDVGTLFWLIVKYDYRADTGAPPPPPPGGNALLGGLDMRAYCRARGFDDVQLSVNEWVCTTPRGAISVDMNDACQWQYGQPAAVARQRVPGNAQTWTCYTGGPGTPAAAPPDPALLGGVDLQAYCRAGEADDVSLRGTTWYCDFGPELLDPVDMDEACRWQYSRPDAYAVQRTPNDPQSWICRLP